MQATIRKGSSFKGSRLVVKAFKTEELAHEFMNKQPNNNWTPNNFANYMGIIPSTKDLKAGTYTYAGGQYHNVKSLDASALAHI